MMRIGEATKRVFAFIVSNGLIVGAIWGALVGIANGAYVIFQPVVDDFVSGRLNAIRAQRLMASMREMDQELIDTICLLDGHPGALSPGYLNGLIDKLNRRADDGAMLTGAKTETVVRTLDVAAAARNAAEELERLVPIADQLHLITLENQHLTMNAQGALGRMKFGMEGGKETTIACPTSNWRTTPLGLDYTWPAEKPDNISTAK